MANDQSYYATGTASVANGGTSVTGVGTYWDGIAYEGDLFYDPATGIMARIAADATSDTGLTLAHGWPGGALSGDSYEIWFRADSIRNSERARQVIDELSVVAANGRGLFMRFDDGTADADPGNGNIRFDNADITLATAACIDNLDANGATISAIIDTWDDAGATDERGQFWVRKIATPEVAHYFNLTATVVDGTGYRKLTLEYIGGSGSLSGEDELMVSFLPIGVGAAGADGTFLNRLINGNGAINQRAATSQGDDTYAWDRHYVLTQTAAIGVSTVTDVSDGLTSMMRLTQSQATAQRMGVAQIIESKNCKDLRGQAVTLLGKLRCSSAQAIRYAILEWTGTADAVTSDVVNSWTNATFTAGQFFNSTTLTVTQVGTITPSAATVTDFLLTTTLGSSVNNVIVMIWTEGTSAQNVTLDVAWEFVGGNLTGSVYPVAERLIGQERALCQRYFCKSFSSEVAPTEGATSIWIAGFSWNSVAIGTQQIGFPVEMRAAPTITFYKPNNITGTNGKWQWYDPSLSAYQDSSATIVTNSFNTTRGFSANLTVTGATALGGYIVRGNWTAEAEL